MKDIFPRLGNSFITQIEPMSCALNNFDNDMITYIFVFMQIIRNVSYSISQ